MQMNGQLGVIQGGRMKQLMKTRATYRGIGITVSSDRLDGKKMFTCRNSITGPASDDKWFPTQGEALANERHEIDKEMGITRE